MADRVTFLDTDFDRMPLYEAIELLMAQLLKRQGGRVYYANAHTMVTAAKNPALAKALEQSDLLLADGSGVRWGSALLGTPLVHNLNGTDLVPALCKEGAAKGLSVYFLGGKPGVAEEAAANLKKAYSGLIIAGTQDGYFPESQTQQVLEAIRIARPHLLLVAMGVPLQEIWINQYASQLPRITCMGVGGLFDFMAERVARAPYPIRSVGMEWLWRLAMEPTRLWQRYLLGNFIFLRLVLTYAFARRQSEEQSSQITLAARNKSGFENDLNF
ncbi:WecB/TagA/CpsF family glycosyltransferase [Nostoc sp.]|uniref:WecB/TagA/CpsF family glycosyltransferase n=1 Tax=Nostoc sp. TaxID=1180 RepID=UPI002FF50BE9